MDIHFRENGKKIVWDIYKYRWNLIGFNLDWRMDLNKFIVIPLQTMQLEERQ